MVCAHSKQSQFTSDHIIHLKNYAFQVWFEMLLVYIESLKLELHSKFQLMAFFFSEVKYRSLLSICFIQFTEFIPLYEGGGIIKIRISQFIRYITFMYKQKQRNNQATGTKWRSFCIILNQKRIEMVIYHFCTCKMKKAKCFLFLDWQQKNERKLKFHISSKSLNLIHLEFAVQAIIGRIKHRLTKPHYYATIYWPSRLVDLFHLIFFRLSRVFLLV